MKKKFKKLSLTTETVRHLSEPSLKEAAGGVSATDCTAACTVCTGTCSACTGTCSNCTIHCSICCP